ncbi:MAG TPA: DMT family transporter [Pseudolabrys sp.]|nr:DMT family transporter [Pseudolabrys sp.]
MKRSPGQSAANGAKLLVPLLALGWGFNWIATRFILEVLQPWSLRAIGVSLGALTLFATAYFAGIPLRIGRDERVKVIVAGLFNVAIFGVCSAYAQVYGTTSRAIVIAYSMPIWSALLARIVLKERFTKTTLIALGLCAAGLATLISPLARTGFPFGALLALGCAWSWAAGTIYLKSAVIRAPTLIAAAWQLLFGAVVLTCGALLFEGLPHLHSISASHAAWIAYNGFIGMGFTYFVWFIIVDRLLTTTASLATLLVPVVGVIGSAALLGERPNFSDSIGFALIFCAAACVLLQPNAKHPEAPE